MNAVSIDILSLIIQKLPLQQKYQVLLVNQKFEEASSLILKEQTSLSTINLWNPQKLKSVKLEEGRLKCFMDEHYVRITSDFIEPKWFGFGDIETEKKILSRLSGLKVIFLDHCHQETLKLLSSFCPKLECLAGHGYETPVLLKQANLRHYSSVLSIYSSNQLPNCYPSLTCLHTWGKDLNLLQPHSFREGLETLELDVFNINLESVFKSPAMKTVKRLKIRGTTDVNFNAEKLKEIEVETYLHDQDSLNDLCSSLGRSLTNSPGCQSFCLKSNNSKAWIMSPLLFYSMDRLESVSLPVRLKNTLEVLQVICSMNPNLEHISVGSVYRSKILEIISSLTQLKSLFIDNSDRRRSQPALTLKDLDEFVDKNTVNNKLRFSFTLIQRKNFPGKDCQVMWRGISWLIPVLY